MNDNNNNIVSDKMDAKFTGNIYKVKDDSLVPEETWICFLVKDNAFFSILPLYRAQCVRLGCDNEQVLAIDRMIRRATAWRLANPDKCKNPDAAGEKLLDI